MREGEIHQLLLGILLQHLRNLVQLLRRLSMDGRCLILGFLGNSLLLPRRVPFLVPVFFYYVKFIKHQLSVFVQRKVLRNNAVAEIVHKLRQAHHTVSVFHAIFAPFDEIVQLIGDRDGAALIRPDPAGIFRHIYLLIRIQRVLRLKLFLDDHQLRNVGYRVPKQVVKYLRLLKLQI